METVGISQVKNILTGWTGTVAAVNQGHFGAKGLTKIQIQTRDTKTDSYVCKLVDHRRSTDP